MSPHSVPRNETDDDDDGDDGEEEDESEQFPTNDPQFFLDLLDVASGCRHRRMHRQLAVGAGVCRVTDALERVVVFVDVADAAVPTGGTHSSLTWVR